MVRGREGVLRLGAATLVVLALAACGGGGRRDEARAFYHSYRATEDERTDAEERLRRAFSDLASAAGANDRGGVLSAATRGEIAANQIRRLLAREIEAAVGLERFERTMDDAARMEQGLRTTRRAVRLVERQLAIAHDDPFLDLGVNEREVNALAREALTLSVRGELAIRRADRAIALALDVEPRFDPIFDVPRTP